MEKLVDWITAPCLSLLGKISHSPTSFFSPRFILPLWNEISWANPHEFNPIIRESRERERESSVCSHTHKYLSYTRRGCQPHAELSFESPETFFFYSSTNLRKKEKKQNPHNYYWIAWVIMINNPSRPPFTSCWPPGRRSKKKRDLSPSRSQCVVANKFVCVCFFFYYSFLSAATTSALPPISGDDDDGKWCRSGARSTTRATPSSAHARGVDSSSTS